jgi:hypothetical protein
MRWGSGRRAGVVAYFAVAISVVACGKVERNIPGSPDANDASDARSDPTMTDSGRRDGDLDAPPNGAEDAPSDVAPRDTSGDATPANDTGPGSADGSFVDRMPGFDAEQDAPRDGSKKCVLGQAKVGDCTL